MRIAMLVSSLVLVMLGSCSTSRKTADGAQLAGQYWKLVEINGNRLTGVQLSREPFLVFSALDSRISGNSSCNHFFGNYSLGANQRISIGQVGATKMACPEMSIEQQLFETLPQVVQFQRSGDSLQLMNAANVTVAKFIVGEGKQ